ncbi:NUDIX domain-containing protein [Alkalicoccobacillus murimartini]|uniref:Mutator protein MutT n=1 Tax=Alkalicoccobacillus murimartini TaxID=171685 RepID=A0ABT9YL88_9BACI|nr:NUDIX domain-containing protein [Alkalicoccobacillus murimartini]MDQ0208638.1 mutator protein MutT [Alkalicoccobacillus murimartini]
MKPSVGVGALILDQDKNILLVKRKRSPEAGCWSLPGGKVDYMETIENAVVREIKEELNIDITVKELLCVTNHIIKSEDIHYVAPTFLAEITRGTVHNMEPQALESVQWFSIKDIPKNITITTDNALKHLLI